MHKKDLNKVIYIVAPALSYSVLSMVGFSSWLIGDSYPNVSINGETGEIEETVRLFKSMEDFKNISYEEMEEINQEENIKILPNGQFLVFLKSKSIKNKEKSNTTIKNNVTADTETYKGE